MLVETIFDALNAKAASVAIKEVREKLDINIPIIYSAAVGMGGETMISAMKIESFINSFRHMNPLPWGSIARWDLNLCVLFFLNYLKKRMPMFRFIQMRVYPIH